MTIAIIGVGSVGAHLGQRLAETGHTVVFGVRPGKDISELLEACGPAASAASVAEAVASAEIVVLAVPAHAAVDALAGCDVDGRIVVDANNPLRWEDGPVWDPPAEGSTTAQLAAAYPSARWVKGFNTFGAEFHRHPDLGGVPIDVQLAGDDAEAKAAVASMAEGGGWTAVDVGPLRNAAALENLAVLWIQLAMFQGRGRFAGFKLLEREAAQP